MKTELLSIMDCEAYQVKCMCLDIEMRCTEYVSRAMKLTKTQINQLETFKDKYEVIEFFVKSYDKVRDLYEKIREEEEINASFRNQIRSIAKITMQMGQMIFTEVN